MMRHVALLLLTVAILSVLLVAASPAAQDSPPARAPAQADPPRAQPQVEPSAEPATEEEAPAAEEEADDEAEPEKDKPLMTAGTFSALRFRSIGPALASGRIGDFAVDPENRAHYFVAVASGGVWKTTNAGTTFSPVFDGQGSYSIGCITMDPTNPSVIWVGTGENNSQRSVSFGDGVYRSRDGGSSWTNVGLKESEHIGMIAVDPRDGNVVYVAAHGPLWRSGGDRGLYQTTDGGETWTRILHVSDDTGINEVHLDPRNPDVIYATAYQRRRHVWTLIDGGPEGGIYKSTDAGATWRKINRGLPGGDKGRIGLDIAPSQPDVIYAIVEAAKDKSGFYRSTDRGENWQRRSDYATTSAQYYNEIVCDPNDVDRVYVLDTILRVTEDGGRTFQRVPRTRRHVDDHALWIDPDNSDYILVGCDGGIYDSHDRGRSWAYKPNLPVTQFYRVTVDNSSPFYFVYGGTQDNNSVGGPSRTISPDGITNEDWFVTQGGDGFETQIDPVDPNIVYSQLQYAGIVRYDRRSGERVDIKPREKPGGEPYRWNWDSPLIISPHDHKRLYFAANILFRSDDRGNSWRAVSGDLTRQLDRNALPVFGKIWPPEAVAKHDSTSDFGNIVSLAESPLEEGLIYVGTDDGLVQVTEDGGETWRRIDAFPSVPEMTYVSCLIASLHHVDTVYAAFDNHKQGDFAPYVLKSTDRGLTWEPINGDLPARHIVYALAEDHVKEDLLFAGTEFGAFFTPDGGGKWIELSAGIPTIAVRDVDIQRRENDLVLGTFGRGFYILDDYTPLRLASEEALKAGPIVFPVKPALRYIQSGKGRGSQGASYYTASNPPFGAVFTYWIDEKITTRRERRTEAWREAEKNDQTPVYPTIEELRAEDEERAPAVIFTIRDEAGEVVRRLSGSRSKGLHRATWDLRYAAATPVSVDGGGERSSWRPGPSGPLALPGRYTVTLASEVDGVVTPLAAPVTFEVVDLALAAFAARAEDRQAMLAFQQKVARLQGAVQAAQRVADDAQSRIDHARKAILEAPRADPAMLTDVQHLQERLNAMRTALRGDRTRSRREETTPPSISSRIGRVVWNQFYVTSPPTQTQRDQYRYAGEEFAALLKDLRALVEQDLPALEQTLDAVGAPWTPGRFPHWEME